METRGGHWVFSMALLPHSLKVGSLFGNRSLHFLARLFLWALFFTFCASRWKHHIESLISNYSNPYPSKFHTWTSKWLLGMFCIINLFFFQLIFNVYSPLGLRAGFQDTVVRELLTLVHSKPRLRNRLTMSGLLAGSIWTSVTWWVVRWLSPLWAFPGPRVLWSGSASDVETFSHNPWW